MRLLPKLGGGGQSLQQQKQLLASYLLACWPAAASSSSSLGWHRHFYCQALSLVALPPAPSIQRFATRKGATQPSCIRRRLPDRAPATLRSMSRPSSDEGTSSATSTHTSNAAMLLLPWTVCVPCRGLGQLPQRSSGKRRKRRQQHQEQQRLQHEQNSRPAFDGVATRFDRGDDKDDADGDDHHDDRGCGAVASAVASNGSATASVQRPWNTGRRCEACEGTGIVERTVAPESADDQRPCVQSSSLAARPLPSSSSLPLRASSSRDWTVAIIGGGLAGLALHAALRHRGVASAVYERDATFAARHQGYGLTLQQSSRALASFGIRGPLREGVTSTKHVVHAADGTVLGSWGYRQWGRSETGPPPKRQNVHIARQSLRSALLDACGGEAAVQWNHKLIKYQRSSSSDDDDANSSHELVLTFQVGDGDGCQTVERAADFVVGADGIRSAVREQLLSHVDGTDNRYALRYLGCLVVLGICPLDEATKSSSDLLDGETVFQTADGTTRMYMMPYSATAYMWQLSFPLEESVASKISREGRASLLRTALERCGGWHAPIPGILQHTPSDLVSGYPLYDRALLSSDDLAADPRVTLIGDACHPMSPFKGQGANQALLDALALARCLYAESGLADFEREMLHRSAVKVQASAEAARFLHSEVCLTAGNVTRGGAAAAASASSLAH
jgi:salicylate hydroxylase